MTRILRLAGATTLLTATSFERLFREQIGQLATVTTCDPIPWFECVLGAPGAPMDTATGERLRAATAAVDFVCPGYQAIPLAPLLVALRNRFALPWRLLFIAHAAASYHREWLLLQGQLVPGDVIIAPSRTATLNIALIAPALRPFVRTIAHPTPVPAQLSGRARREIVFLGRIHADKLLHRQIDAYALLRRRTPSLPPMAIYGSLDDGAGVTPSQYARALQARIDRLQLTDAVTLRGAVTDPAAKAQVLEQASLLVNLSTTLEESCPKAPLEAQAHGAPVLGTAWNGLRDTVAPDTGLLVPVRFPNHDDERLDADPERIADGMAQLLARPAWASGSRDWVMQFSPSQVLPRYRAAIEESLSARADAPVQWPTWPAQSVGRTAAPSRGLLHGVASLRAVSEARAFGWYLELTTLIRESWSRRRIRPYSDAETFYASIERALSRPLLTAAATGVYDLPPDAEAMPESLPDAAPFREVLLYVATHGHSVRARAAATQSLVTAGESASARDPLFQLLRTHPSHPDVLLLHGAFVDRCESPSRALALVRSQAMRAPWGEDDGPRLRQFSRIARHAGDPIAAATLLASWLQAYPDALDSGSVWLELAICRIRGRASAVAIDEALEAAERLLGDVPALRKARAEHQVHALLAVAP